MNSNASRSPAACASSLLALCALRAPCRWRLAIESSKNRAKCVSFPARLRRCDVRARLHAAEFRHRRSGVRGRDFAGRAWHTAGRTSACEVDGHDAYRPTKSPGRDSRRRPTRLRIPLDPAWTAGQTRQLSIEYTLRSPRELRLANHDRRRQLSSCPRADGSRSFSRRSACSPPLQYLPKVVDFSVRVPADFVLLAGGIPKGKKKDGEEIEYRFELGRGEHGRLRSGGEICGVAGAAQIARHRFSGRSQPLKDDPSCGVATNRRGCGTRWRKTSVRWTKRSRARTSLNPRNCAADLTGETAPAAVAFPGWRDGESRGAGAWARAATNFFEIVSHALAQEWFGESMYSVIRGGGRHGRGPAGVCDHGDRRSSQRPGRPPQAGRPNICAATTKPLKAATETPLSAIMLERCCRPAPHRSGQGAAFLHRAGGCLRRRADASTGLANLLAAAARARGWLRGPARGARAIEQQRIWRRMFRLWLNQKGIPEDFRLRYQGNAVGEVAQNWPTSSQR